MTDTSATLIDRMVANHGWIGLPPIQFQGRIIDGRARLACVARFGWHEPPPKVAESWRAAARLLVLAGHDVRAGELARAWGAVLNAHTVAMLRLAPADAARVLACWRKLDRAERPRAKPANRTARIVRRLRALVREIEERGRPATLAELKEVLECPPRDTDLREPE